VFHCDNLQGGSTGEGLSEKMINAEKQLLPPRQREHLTNVIGQSIFSGISNFS
jgi:hypothetical protein